MLNTVCKIRGQVKTTGYPQPEGILGDCMLRYGRELGTDALSDIGEALKQMADVKDSLDIGVKHNFIDPLQTLQEKDLKEIGHHLKKLEGRRLDCDYKKRRQGKVPEEELRQAVEKFEESKELAERSMFNFLESDVEQVSQLAALIDAALEFHRQITAASSRPKREFKPKSVVTSIETVSTPQHNGITHTPSLKSTLKTTEPLTPISLSWPESPKKNGESYHFTHLNIPQSLLALHFWELRKLACADQFHNEP
ncbi:hypothetical protein JZ751_019448 [Albula glossodonta]|uniref:BAR domain-containing protein n=1 Tax=Albula glossodonta TaxID=121402 RepID=A0A8T2NKS6_9TELE|nr:hypothetical protein JZ751_019448 [Albula glossodonta]